MTTLTEMSESVFKVLHNKFKKFAAPLVDHFGISQICYWRLSNSGHYVFLGLRPEWEEYCCSEKIHINDPYLRHPKYFSNGICHVKAVLDDKWQGINQMASTKFKINYSLGFINKIANGMEGFGFALKSPDPLQHAAFSNELPLLQLFIKKFHTEFSSFYPFLDENRVEIASQIGSAFYKPTVELMSKFPDRQQYLKKMGVEPPPILTNREQDVSKHVIKGFSASQIGKELFISSRTVEHHLERIKDKFCCSSKSELIQKIQELESIEYFGF